MKRAMLVIAALLVAGFVYEQIGARRDRTRYLQIGRSVDIVGRTLNNCCSGEGGPAVIFEGAGHTAGFAWKDMQAEVAKFTRACWCDRAGYGWSDPGPSPRTFKSIANDLHALVSAAAIPPLRARGRDRRRVSRARLYCAVSPRRGRSSPDPCNRPRRICA